MSENLIIFLQKKLKFKILMNSRLIASLPYFQLKMNLKNSLKPTKFLATVWVIKEHLKALLKTEKLRRNYKEN